MSVGLLLGLPSKGRIHDEALACLARAGFSLERGSGRGYAARLEPIGAEVRLLSAGEIATNLDSGAIHAGITGLDVIAERLAEPKRTVMTLRPLGFSRARVIVAVPQGWLDVETMADLYDVAVGRVERGAPRLKVATKLIRMTRSFFARSGIVDYRIVESLGATEGAPAAGIADLIVDITETGATLAANQLKILTDGEIMASEAALVASLTAPWSGAGKAALRTLMNGLAPGEAERVLSALEAALPRA